MDGEEKLGDNDTNTGQGPEPVIIYDAKKEKKWYRPRLPKFLKNKYARIAVPVAILAVGGFLFFAFFLPKTYTVGTHRFNENQVEQLAASLQQGGEAASEKQAMKRLILLSALKTEADKRNVTYTSAEIDTFLKDRYSQHGGKRQYTEFMAKEYSWTPEQVQEYQTTEYLKQKLQKELLSERSYTAVQLRWDNIKIFHKEQFDKIYAEKLAVFNDFYKPLFEEKTTDDQLKGLVDITQDMPQADQSRIFMERQAMPVYLMNIPPEQQASANPAQLYSEGEDMYKKLRELDKPGDFTQPFKANTGMLLIARLNESKGGIYGNWDHMVEEYAQTAKIPRADYDTDLEEIKEEKTSWVDKLRQVFSRQVVGQEVYAAVPAPTCNATASRYNITPGQSVTVSWSFQNTRPSVPSDRGSDLPGFNQGPTSGSQTVNPSVTTTYRFYAKNADHGVRVCDSVTITIEGDYGFAADCLAQGASTVTYTINYVDIDTGLRLSTNHSVGVLAQRGRNWCTMSGYTSRGWGVSSISPPINPGPYQIDFAASKSFQASGGRVVIEADCMGPLSISNVNAPIAGYTLVSGYTPPTGNGTNGMGFTGTVYYSQNGDNPPPPPPPPPPPVLTQECEVTSMPASVKAGEVVSVSVRVSYTGGLSVSPSDYLAPGTATVPGPPQRQYANEFHLDPLTSPERVPGPSSATPSHTFSFQVRAPSNPKNDAAFVWTLISAAPKAREIICMKLVNIEPPKNAPYITISGADVVSGAAFGVDCAPTTAALDADINTNGYYSSQQLLGRLDGYSTSQYAVLASGEVGDNAGSTATDTFLGNYGYNRSELPSTGGNAHVKDALFGNISYNLNQYGNFYEQQGSGLPCIRLNDPAAAAPANNPAATSFVQNGSGTVKYSGNITLGTLSGASSVRNKKTLIVDGDVTLSGSITYATSAGSYGDVGAIPDLTIIANNLYIQKNARTLDGRYIAYPRSSNDGVIDTCSDVQWYTSGGAHVPAQAGQWPATGAMRIDSCELDNPAIDNPGITINGSLTARRILWKRTNGTLGRKDQVADPACYYGNFNTPADGIVVSGIDTSVQRLKQCAAERIDFSAEKYLSGFTDGLNIDSVPTNTAELPPVY